MKKLPDSLLQVHVQAIKEEYEVVVCDTSGRLHTNAQLMDELAKCKRAIGKRLAGAPHETLLVLDGTSGHHSHHSAYAHASASLFTLGLHCMKTTGHHHHDVL